MLFANGFLKLIVRRNRKKHRTLLNRNKDILFTKHRRLFVIMMRTKEKMRKKREKKNGTVLQH